MLNKREQVENKLREQKSEFSYVSRREKHNSQEDEPSMIIIRSKNISLKDSCTFKNKERNSEFFIYYVKVWSKTYSKRHVRGKQTLKFIFIL